MEKVRSNWSRSIWEDLEVSDFIKEIDCQDWRSGRQRVINQREREIVYGIEEYSSKVAWKWSSPVTGEL